MPYALGLTLATACAFAQSGSIDTSGVSTLATTLVSLCRIVGGLACIAGLAFSVFNFFSGNIGRGLMGAVGIVFGAIILGFGPTWVQTLTGLTLS